VLPCHEFPQILATYYIQKLEFSSW